MWMVVWRPVAAGTVHNLIVGVALLTLALALVRASVEVKTARGWLLVGAHALLIGFLVRSLPALVLQHPPLHDTYFYLASLLNVTEANTLDPVYSGWYSQVGQQLNWPVLQLLTAQVASWSGADPIDVALYLPAAFGSLSYFALGLLAYVAFATWRVAALAGVFGGFVDGLLYFQSEYQPQGLALLTVFFFLFLLVASRASPSIRARSLMILVGAALLFTHHGSTLLLPILVGPLLVLPIVARRVLLVARADGTGAWHAVMKVVAGLAEYGSVSVLLIVATIALHLYYYDAIIRFIVASVDPSALFQGGSTVGPSPELWFSALRATKYVLLAICLLGIWRTLRSPTANPVLLGVLSSSLIAGALISLAAFPGGALRFFAMALPVATIFGAYALVGTNPRRSRQGRVLQLGALALGALSVVGGIANAQSPSVAYLFADPPRSAGAWYGGALPRTDLVALAGQWLGKNDTPERIYAVDFSTAMAPFFFGHISDTRMIVGGPDPRRICRANVFVVDYPLTAEGFMEPRLRFSSIDLDRAYDNGSVAIFLGRQPGCKP
jgi:hypothetical protein